MQRVKTELNMRTSFITLFLRKKIRSTSGIQRTWSLCHVLPMMRCTWGTAPALRRSWNARTSCAHASDQQKTCSWGRGSEKVRRGRRKTAVPLFFSQNSKNSSDLSPFMGIKAKIPWNQGKGEERCRDQESHYRRRRVTWRRRPRKQENMKNPL